MPPHAMPPTLPGTTSVPFSDGGVKKPSDRSAAMVSRHQARSSSVAPQASSGFKAVGASASRRCGERLRRRGDLARHIALRDRALLDGNERRSRLAIEDEEMAGLGGDTHGGNGPAVLAPVEQDRRRRDVVVPEIVMDGLEMPDARPGVRTQRHDRVRKQVVAEPLAAEVVVAGAARSARRRGCAPDRPRSPTRRWRRQRGRRCCSSTNRAPTAVGSCGTGSQRPFQLAR